MSLDDVRAQERRRCEAMVASDIATLEQLLADEMSHIHISGHVDNKTSYIADTQSKYRYHAMQRLTYDLRDHGDIVLATGTLSLDMTVLADNARHVATLVTSQVWVRTPGGWQQANYHASRIG